ncbi:Rpn family recombination-promoting nuclease/putative transposase [Gracilibacillus timonensis]|uniref:Rpn family recombination-promoting nuclease/putative transposase n=1 Tax=Gracilibacillus timonensis TaxID=1816696 RepID=UPI000B0D4B2C|nr:Rpn family recombination-promoting nuclease/putative transposase [Gracilibacillus timonensis]
MLSTSQTTSYHLLSTTNQMITEDLDNYEERQYYQSLYQMGEHELMDLKVDYAFKQLFGSEKNKEITRSFLNGFLLKSGKGPIQSLTFKNVEISREYENDKAARLDLLIETANNEKINVEIQFANQYNMVKRTLYYWARIYEQPLTKAQEYDVLQPVLTINIMNFNLFEDVPDYHTVYQLLERRMHIPLTDLIECHFVEMPKLIKAWEEKALDPKEDPLTRWLLLLGSVDKRRNKFHEDIFQELEELAMNDQTLQDAMDNWNELSQTEEQRLRYEARLKNLLDEQSRQRSMERKAEQIRQREEQIKQREKKVVQREDRIEQREDKIVQKEDRIEQREDKIVQREDRLKQKQEALKQKQELIDQKQETVTDQRNKLEQQTQKATVSEIARQLLRQGLEIGLISESTGLSITEISMLQQELDNERNKN